jgi:hypothetical protein
MTESPVQSAKAQVDSRSPAAQARPKTARSILHLTRTYNSPVRADARASRSPATGMEPARAEPVASCRYHVDQRSWHESRGRHAAHPHHLGESLVPL